MEAQRGQWWMMWGCVQWFGAGRLARPALQKIMTVCVALFAAACASDHFNSREGEEQEDAAGAALDGGDPSDGAVGGGGAADVETAEDAQRDTGSNSSPAADVPASDSSDEGDALSVEDVGDAGDVDAGEPLTCEGAGASCGELADGLGAVLDCGACDAGEVCEANQCVDRTLLAWDWGDYPSGWEIVGGHVSRGRGNPAPGVTIDGYYRDSYTFIELTSALPQGRYEFVFDVRGNPSTGCGSSRQGASGVLEAMDSQGRWIEVWRECVAHGPGEGFESRSVVWSGEVSALRFDADAAACRERGDVTTSCGEFVTIDNLQVMAAPAD